MRKSEFILAGKRYEIVKNVIEKMALSLTKKYNLDYIASDATFNEDYLEIEIIHNSTCDNYHYELEYDTYKIYYDDLEF